MPPITRTTLAPGLDIARVVTGLWQIADMERDGRALDLDLAAAAMEPYIAAGFTSFDMADHYGSAEVIAGRSRALGDPARLQLFTKWVPKPGPVDAADVRTAIERSLERLRMPAIDLLQFHAWNYADPSWLDALFHLQDLKREGLIRHLGLTNVDAAHLRVALTSGIEIVSNQVSSSLIDRRAAGKLAAVCAEFGVGLLAYGTVCGGWLSEKWLGRDEPDWERDGTWSQMKYGRFVREAGGWPALQRVLRAASDVAERHGVSLTNVATRYILEQRGVAAVIVGARLGERAHIDDNQRLCSFQLSGDDRTHLEAAIATLAPIPGDCGDEYPTAAVPDRVRRSQPSSRGPAGAFLGHSRPQRHHQVLQRHAVGAAGRLLAGDACGCQDSCLRHDRHPRQPPHRRRRPGGPDPRRHRQDRRRAAVAGRTARRRRADAHLRVERGPLGGGVARPRRALRPHPAGQHAGGSAPHRRRVPGGDRGRGGSAVAQL